MLATAVDIIGGLFTGQAQKNQHTYQAGVAEANARLFQQNATVAEDIGERQARISGMRTAQVVGQQRAGAGAGNLNPTVGSPAQIRESEILAGRTTQQNIRYGAAQNAFGEQIKAFSSQATAGLEKTAAATALPAAEWQIAGSVLGEASSVASKWQQASQLGTPSPGYMSSLAFIG